MRSSAVVALPLVVGCLDARDVLAPSDASARDGRADGFEEAGPASDLDAAAELDAPAADAASSLDSASTDARALDAGCRPWNACYERDTEGVACDGSVCSGETPICCRNDYAAGWACVGAERWLGCAEPPGTPMASNGVPLRCDEAGDCARGELCFDSHRKGNGVGRTDGARCEPFCIPPTTITFRYQVCRRDCECEPPKVCRYHSCVAP